MNPAQAHLLTSIYPRAWRERYGAEFEALLQAGPADRRTSVNVVWSALRERIFPTPGLPMNPDPRPSQFQTWCVRAPWAMFGVAPVLVLAVAYFVACFILWSGWRIFLPGTSTPFVRVDGFAVLYFNLGRLIYLSAPILIGWGVGIIAGRYRLKAAWPFASLALIAWMGGTAQVRASLPVPSGGGRVSMQFVVGHSAQSISPSLTHALVILSISMLPYFIFRLQSVGRFPPKP